MLPRESDDSGAESLHWGVKPPDVEGLNLRLEERVEVPFWALEIVRFLQESNILSPSSLIVNLCSETRLDIEGTDLDSLVLAINGAGIQTTDRIPLVLQDRRKTFDFYAEGDKYTQRLRLYCDRQGNPLESRVITAVLPEQEGPVTWQWSEGSAGFTAEAGRGCVLVERSDLLSEDLKQAAASQIASFCSLHGGLVAAVYKETVRGFTGRNWSHCSARNPDGEDLEGILTMGPYIGLQIQKVECKREACGNILLSGADLTELPSLFKNYPGERVKSLRVEVECMGAKEEREGAYILYQLTNTFNNSGISFREIKENKISIPSF